MMETPVLGADLHVHTCHSDGRDTPAQILEKAAGKLGLVSICDHDTIAAYDHLEPHESVAVLPGVEITAQVGDQVIHVLGYFPRGFPPGFRDHVRTWEEDRRQRVLSGVRRLRERGLALRWELLDRVVGDGVPCRSHVARALVEMGVGRSPHGLYRRYLTADHFVGPSLSGRDALGTIAEGGGVSVWAHPRGEDVERFGQQLVRDGLQGVELYRRGRDRSRHEKLEAFRDEHGLHATGGSDYHGESRRTQLGRFRVPMDRIPEVLRSPTGSSLSP